MHTNSESLEGEPLQTKSQKLHREEILSLAGLAAVVLLAAVLRFANISSLGYVNHYYSAAVKSMLQSWQNFFFVAAEPGGSVSVDKPPLGLWLQTASAAIFGVNGFGVLLPQLVAGILSVILIFYLVRRWFGSAAGLLAALALAITPIVVATDRNNTIDSTLIFTLLLAAWAFIKATETHRLRFLLTGAALVGIGFNIKMLEAFLPLPAFYALYFLGAAEGLGKKLGKLAAATTLLVVISLSWSLVVDLTPASMRPYVGSSGDNSELNLITGYNGMQRLLGMGGNRNRTLSFAFQAPAVDSNQTARPSRPSFDGSQGNNNNGGIPGGLPPFNAAPGNMPQNGAPGNNGGFPGGAPDGNNRGFQGGGGPMSGTGRAGLLRLFTAPLSKEVSWLLPFGLLSMILLLFSTRLSWPISQKHQALVLWGGWLATGGVFFSVAGFFHEYYLTMLAAPLAAVVAAGTAELWHLRSRNAWLASGLLFVGAAVTVAFQVMTASSFVQSMPWLPLVIALGAAGLVCLIWSVARSAPRAALAGFVCLMAAMLVTPGVWSALTTVNSSDNQSLPSAYSGRASGPSNRGDLSVNQDLLDYLQAHTRDYKYLMAVPSSMQGADYVLATGRPVLYMGGFMGQDQVVNGDDLARMVANKELRFIYWGVREAFGGQSSVSSWVSANCKAVQGFETTARNAGAPDGTSGGAQGVSNSSSMRVSLYDCAAE